MSVGYRAWHKENKKMLHVCGIDYMVNLDTDSVDVAFIKCAERSDEGWSNGGTHDADDVILMQDTGIKDKNGVKIYKGCVLDIKSPVMGCEIADVRYANGSFRIGDSPSLLGGYLSHEIEVIGNIYENPELLEN